jgi:hypothetical protein
MTRSALLRIRDPDAVKDRPSCARGGSNELSEQSEKIFCLEIAVFCGFQRKSRFSLT